MGLLQGRFKPKNPQKYKGNPTNIVYRSSWELKFMMDLDHSSNVIEWSSEETIIAYNDKASGRMRRYFPDFLVKKKLPDNTIVTYLIEIKPSTQIKAPKRPQNKKSKTYIKEVLTYATNTSKWEAAERYCAKRGYEFRILSEKELGLWI